MSIPTDTMSQFEESPDPNPLAPEWLPAGEPNCLGQGDSLASGCQRQRGKNSLLPRLYMTDNCPTLEGGWVWVVKKKKWHLSSKSAVFSITSIQDVYNLACLIFLNLIPPSGKKIPSTFLWVLYHVTYKTLCLDWMIFFVHLWLISF